MGARLDTAAAGPTRAPLRILLLSTYDLGRQPFGLASPAAWLREAGATVQCIDLAIDRLDEGAIASADLVAFHLPMHTATRIAARAIPRVRAIRPSARIACYGLYAAMNETYLRRLGVEFILGGEFEAGLVAVAARIAETETESTISQTEPAISLERLRFVTPDRTGLAALSRYARVHDREGRIRSVGYTEASRGCKHRCRHCPVVPVYDGRFRIVQREVVLADVRRQVEAGAEHISFGDPDFWNGIGHALPIVEALHAEHPAVTYDAIIKIEHLLHHREHLATLVRTGCLFVTSAVESVDDRVLAILEKGHTRADFAQAVHLCREADLPLNPTFVAFMPWVDLAGYRELLSAIVELDLVDHVAPIQLAIRLLIPAGSKLLELPEVHEWIGPFDESALVYPWRHADPAVDRLQAELLAWVQSPEVASLDRRAIFDGIWRRAASAAGDRSAAPARLAPTPGRARVPFLTEPWYCCAEPTDEQVAPF